MDYRALLKKYMAGVLEGEGIHGIADAQTTDEEAAELWKIFDEIDAEAKRD